MTLDHVSGAGSPAEAAAQAAGAGLVASQAPQLGVLAGDLATLVAALCYSLITVRLPAYASRVDALQLALAKSVLLATLSAAALGITAWDLHSQGQALEQLWPGWQAWQGWAVIVWSALGPGALAGYFLVRWAWLTEQ